uniref:Replication protein A subunit n=1 Tax=Gongylonema pulchrum TaxID=637853 RepID=A0A183EDI5_9BILA
LDREKIEQPKLSLAIVRLSNLANHIGEPVDIIAVAEKVNDIMQVTARSSGAQLNKRDIQLIDTSETEIMLTLWGDQTRLYDKEIEGQTIETTKLYRWYRETRPSVQPRNLTTFGGGGDNYARDLRVIGLSQLSRLGHNAEKGAYFNVTAMISSMKADGALYKAIICFCVHSCGTNGCKKKVVEMDDQYRCEKCDVTLDKYKYVLLLSMEISDFSGSQWVTLFEDKAVKLLKKDAESLGQLLDNDMLDEYNEVFSAVRFRVYTFRIRAKSEFYNVS